MYLYGTNMHPLGTNLLGVNMVQKFEKVLPGDRFCTFFSFF